MGKCYCDYCDVFLTNDSVAVRKQHNDGNRHKHNVCEYYRQYVGQQLQQQIDAVVLQFERNVEMGLVRPTYGLPPPAKLPSAPTTTPTTTNTTINNAPVSKQENQLHPDTRDSENNASRDALNQDPSPMKIEPDSADPRSDSEPAPTSAPA